MAVISMNYTCRVPLCSQVHFRVLCRDRAVMGTPLNPGVWGWDLLQDSMKVPTWR